jgi:hypothetical protein
VPTDPFVPPDPDARPRQQQNLPPGVALPAASHWRPDRPGDASGPVPRDGELFGTPGPNVGFAYTLAERVKDRFRLGPHERIDDAVSVVAEIAGKRAAIFGRAPVIHDIEHAMAVLGYDGSASMEFVEARTLMVLDASHDYSRRRALVDAVSTELLRATGAELRDRIDAWRTPLIAKLVPELRQLPTM